VNAAGILWASSGIMSFTSWTLFRKLYFFDTIQKAKKDWQNGYFIEVFSIAAWKFGSNQMTKSLGATLLRLSVEGRISLPQLNSNCLGLVRIIVSVLSLASLG
jgi:hypothetical protein